MLLRKRVLRTAGLAVLACLLSSPAHGREVAGDGPLKTHYVKTGLYLITGGGSNTLVRLTANGMVVVDGKLPGNYDFLSKQLRRISDLPVRIVINTDQHEIRTGTNANFIQSGAQILAHENAALNLTAADPAHATRSLPTQTYERDFTGRLGGIDVRVMHFGNAHTSGDSVVYFPDSRVVAVGDLFAATPDPDFANGGSLVGWSGVLARVLQLDFDIAVPGTGMPVRRADVVALKNRTDALLAEGVRLVRDGVPKSRLMAQLGRDDSNWQFGFTTDQVDRFYAELAGADQPDAGHAFSR